MATSSNLAAIGIDYTAAYEQGGGIGRYVRELVDALAEQDAETSYRLFVAGVQNDLPTTPRANFTWKPTQLSTKWLARIWHRAKIPLPIEVFTGPIDLFHATDFVLPPVRHGTKTLLTVHDLSYVRTPETASPRLRDYLNHVVPRSVHGADHILADSAATRDDLIELYRVPENNITVLLSGVSPHFQRVDDTQAHATIRDKYGIGETPYIFSVGTVQPRKNYGLAAEAVAKLRQQGYDIQLVIAGGQGWLEDDFYQTIDRIDGKSFVKMIGFVDDDDLPTLYSAAACTTFVSLYEGFGFPILESMACGTPVITSNVSSLPEVAGDAAPMVAPNDTEAVISAFQRVLDDTVHRQDLITRGYEQAQRFTWMKSATQLLDVYNMLLNDS